MDTPSPSPVPACTCFSKATPTVCMLLEKLPVCWQLGVLGARKAGKWQTPRAPMDPLSGRTMGWREEP